MDILFPPSHYNLISGDIFAEALLEDLTPRIEPNNLPDVQPGEQSLLPAQLESEQVNSVEAAIKKEDHNSIPETIPEQTENLVKTEQITGIYINMHLLSSGYMV